MIDPAPSSLAGKTCLVTGANGGIGRSTSEHFAALGARVMATDLGPGFKGACEAEYMPLDLTVDGDLDRLAEWIGERSPEVLLNNAAAFDMGSVLDAGLEQQDRLFALNVRAMYAVMRACARQMVKDGKKGSIINLASQAGHRGEALVAHYCATKAAVISYTQSAALALASHGIRVNAISPGVVDTPMWDEVDALFARFENKPKGQKKREVAEEAPLGRMGRPEDVARAAVFLASAQSEYMTAQAIGVDGGNVLRA